MHSESILHAQSSELIAIDDSELCTVVGGHWFGRGRSGENGVNITWGAGPGGFNVDIDVNINVAVIAGNVVLSGGDVLFNIDQS